MNRSNLNELLSQAGQLQNDVSKIQEELAQLTVEASSGGGMVTAIVTGALRVHKIQIEPELFDSGDRSMLEDLVGAAVNSAMADAQRMIEEKMQVGAAGPIGKFLEGLGRS